MRVRVAFFGAFCALSWSAFADIHRCDTENGVLFQDHPCPGGSAFIPSGGTYSTGRGLRDSERKWLREQAGRKKPAKRRSAKVARSADESARERSCWSRRERLETVRAKLRRGYKPSQGERLRRARRQHEDYIARFCD